MALTKISRNLLDTGVSDSSDATAITIDSSERVGISTTSPAFKLDVNGSLASNGNENVMRIAAADSTQAGGITINSIYGDSASQRVTTLFSIDGQDQASPLAFGSGTSERMRIDSSGNLLVGKTTTAFGTAGMHLQGSTGRTLNTVNGDNVMDLNRLTSHGVILGFYLNSVSVGTISTNANNLPSDRNFKRDISDLDLGLDLVTKLKPSQYNYKIDSEDCPKMYGLIAQDLEQALEEVGVEKNSTWLLQHEPKDDEKQSDYSLDYTKLIPILINSIQELSAKVEELESKINE